jgi:hypothetical protein
LIVIPPVLKEVAPDMPDVTVAAGLPAPETPVAAPGAMVENKLVIIGSNGNIISPQKHITDG